MWSKILNFFKPKVDKPVSSTVFIRQYMHPLSKERLEWLKARQIVVETMINKLKLYITQNPSSTGETQINAALGITQAEFLNNQIEIEVLEVYFAQLERQRLEQAQKQKSN